MSCMFLCVPYISKVEEPITVQHCMYSLGSQKSDFSLNIKFPVLVKL